MKRVYTVSELIEELKQYNPDAEVHIVDTDICYSYIICSENQEKINCMNVYFDINSEK